MASLPSGTITFLFTDIEGSTKLNQSYDDVMTAVLARHDELIETHIAEYEGVVVRPRGEGDSRFVVFSKATDAIAAAAIVQQVILTEPWPSGISLKVRIALHTGEADIVNGDYRGTAVDRCARLRSIGYGGQTLLSQTTYDLVRDQLPKDVSLQDLGSHRLKDLQRAEQVFQLLHPALLDNFPPLKSLGSFPNNLPIQPTSFIGRDSEIIAVKERLTVTRLLTLTGPGGSGKTRLALQVGADLLENYSDGVWLVELADAIEVSDVIQKVVTTWGLSEQPGRSLEQILIDYLKPKSMLLLLDNCEHLIHACAQLCTSLLRTCPQLEILATSREPLNIAGEAIWSVPCLSLPNPQKLPALSNLTQYEAVQLFIDRAIAAKHDFQVTNQNAAAVAEICCRLDGIPLAIELAAVRVKSLSPEKILDYLNDQIRLLKGGSRTAMPRQQTLEAAITWSYRLLSELEQTLLRRLAVFSGGWTLEAATGICSSTDLDEFEVMDELANLVEKSLVSADLQSVEEPRYRFLEPIRQYCWEKLQSSGEHPDLSCKHRDWFLALAEQAKPELDRADPGVWLNRLEAEHDNLKTALNWSTSKTEEYGLALRLGSALWRFWSLRGYFSIGREQLLHILDSAQSDADLTERAEVLKGIGNLAYQQGDLDSGQMFQEQSLEICKQLGEQRVLIDCLNTLANIADDRGDYERARVLYEELLNLAQVLKDEARIADGYSGLGIVACRKGDLNTAKQQFENCLLIQQRLQDKIRTIQTLNNLAYVAAEQGEIDLAQARFEECLIAERELGIPAGIAESLQNIGRIFYMKNDYEAAQVKFSESLEIYQQLANKAGIATSLHRLGVVAARLGNLTLARTQLDESLNLQRQVGDVTEIAETLEDLAKVAQTQGDALSARAAYQEGLKLFRQLQNEGGVNRCLEGLIKLENTNYHSNDDY